MPTNLEYALMSYQAYRPNRQTSCYRRVGLSIQSWSSHRRLRRVGLGQG